MNDITPNMEYISPLGNRMANPVLVNRQSDALREVLSRMKSRLPIVGSSGPAVNPDKPVSSEP